MKTSWRMDYAPNPSAYVAPPTEQPHYSAPPMAHYPPKSSLPCYNAPSTAHAARTPPLSHYSAPPSRATRPPYSAAPPAHNTPSTVFSKYSAPPPPVKNPPPTDLPHYVAPEAYYSAPNVVQQSAPSQSYGLSSAHYGYDPHSEPYETRYTHQDRGYGVSGISYQRTVYQSGGYNPSGYPQVVESAATQYPQYPPAKVGLGPRVWSPYPKQKKPKPVTTDHYCEICKIGCSTADDMRVHRQGKKHQKNVEKLQEALTPMIGPQPKEVSDLPKSPSQPAEKKRKSLPTGPASLEELEVKKKRVYDAGAPVDGVRVCGVCNIVVNSQKVFDLHCSGSKHAMMLKRLQEGL